MSNDAKHLTHLLEGLTIKENHDIDQLMGKLSLKNSKEKAKRKPRPAAPVRVSRRVRKAASPVIRTPSAASDNGKDLIRRMKRVLATFSKMREDLPTFLQSMQTADRVVDKLKVQRILRENKDMYTKLQQTATELHDTINDVRTYLSDLTSRNINSDKVVDFMTTHVATLEAMSQYVGYYMPYFDSAYNTVASRKAVMKAERTMLNEIMTSIKKVKLSHHA